MQLLSLIALLIEICILDDAGLLTHIYCQVEVEVAAVVLASSLGFGALSNDCREKIRVEKKCECRVIYRHYLDV